MSEHERYIEDLQRRVLPRGGIGTAPTDKSAWVREAALKIALADRTLPVEDCVTEAIALWDEVNVQVK